MAKVTVAALQIGSDPKGTAATLERILAFENGIAASRARVVVLPEAILGGYPKGEAFGTRLGYRTDAGRDAFARHFAQAVDLEGPEVAALAGLAAQTGAWIIAGVIERDASTLYCTAIFLDPERGLVAKHRKLMPTGSERLVWGMGDGSTLPVVETPAGKAGAAICWENHMPLFRAAMYAKGVTLWCAPTVDERDIWRASMRHIAHEGRCFVISACQVQPSPAELGQHVEEWPSDRPLIRGGSMIVGPLGNLLAGPLENETALVTAEIDTDDIVRARYDFDPVGHYARPDLFRLVVDESPRASVTSGGQPGFFAVTK